MKGIGLAPSPNWYCSKVSDCTSDGIFAFGIKQNIALLNVASNPPVYCGVLNGKSLVDRIVGLCFASTQTELVCAAETGLVTVWNVNNQVELKQFHGHQAKVTCIDWSFVDYNLIASGDEKGYVCLYNGNIRKNQIHKTGQISSLRLSPYDKNIAAVGFRDGLILIIDVQNNCSSIHLLRRHDDEIQSLCWFTTGEKEIFLASGSKDATVRRWDVFEGRLIASSKIPQYSSGHRSRYQDDQTKSRLWVTLYWNSKWDSTLFCSGYHGELLALNLSKESKHLWDVVYSKDSPAQHNRSIFNISGFQTKACTISMDRQIILWDLESRNSITSIATLGGFVYGLHFSPVDIGRLAVGVGDNIIRVWNTQPSAGFYNVSSFWQGLRSKVTTIAWHPKLEGRLAFGTEEGRVGIFNLLSNKSPSISNTNHRGKVYTVVWGVSIADISNADTRSTADTKQRLAIYSCGSGVVLAHPHSFQGDSQDINDIILKYNPQAKRFPSRSEISWNDDLTLMAIGNEDGSIEIYKMPSLKRIARITEVRQLIQCLRWHPTCTGETIESSYRFWLAVSSNAFSICIYDLEPCLKNDVSESCDQVFPKVVRKLEGHKLRVVSLNWSPHVCGHLASVSYDRTAQVWDVIRGKPIANFRGHGGRVFAVEWNPLDPDVIYTGGEDTTVQRWMISEQEHKQPPDINKGKKGKKKKASDEAKCPLPDDVAAELEQLLQSKKEELIRENSSTTAKEKENITMNGSGDAPNDLLLIEDFIVESVEKSEVVAPDQERLVSIVTEISSSRKDFATKKKKKKPFKSVFPISAQLDNRGKAASLNDILLLTEQAKLTNVASNSVKDENNELPHDSPETSDEQNLKFGSNDTSHLGWFGNRMDAYRMLKTEATYHKEHNNLDYAVQLEVWKGNIGNAINLAAAHNQLNDWLVALAPLGSRALWKSTCSLYSKQLMQEGQVYRAVLYLLAVSDVEGAVELFRTKKMYREAISLAKVRLPSDHPVISELLSEWSNQSIKEGNYEIAAKCTVAKGQLGEAGRILSLRSDPCSLKVAAHLANAGGDSTEALRFAEQCVVDFLLKNSWTTVTEVVDTYPSLLVFNYVAEVHKLLYHKIETLTLDKEMWELQPIKQASSLLIWKSSPMEGKSLIQWILHAWQTAKFSLSEGKSMVEDMIAFLEERDEGAVSLLSYNQLLLRVSFLLTTAAFYCVLKETEAVMCKIVEALTLTHQAGESQTFQALCRLFFPDGIVDLEHVLPVVIKEENSFYQLSAQSIRAHYAVAILNFLTSDIFAKEQNASFGAEKLVSDNLDFIDELDVKEKIPVMEIEEKTFSQLNKRDIIANPLLIEELIQILLLDSRAEIYVLENELIYVQKAIVNLTAKLKSTSVCASKEMVEETLSVPLPKMLSKSASTASDMTDKTLDYLETLEISCEEGTLSTSQSDAEVVLELDYTLPCDDRYNVEGIDLTVLRAEKDRIERALRAIPDSKLISFPDPIENAMLLIEYCGRFLLIDLQKRVVNWAKKFAPLKEQREKLFLVG